MKANGERMRVVTWDDPVATAGAGATMSGIDYLRAMLDGKLPAAPIARLIGFQLAEVSEGRVVFALDPGEHLYNPIASVHGGVAATLLDSALACAVHSMLAKGRGYTTLELKINLVRAITRDTGRLLAIGTVVHMGGRVATAEGRLVDANGKLYAHATTTCLIVGEKTA